MCEQVPRIAANCVPASTRECRGRVGRASPAAPPSSSRANSWTSAVIPRPLAQQPGAARRRPALSASPSPSILLGLNPSCSGSQYPTSNFIVQINIYHSTVLMRHHSPIHVCVLYDASNNEIPIIPAAILIFLSMNRSHSRRSDRAKIASGQRRQGRAARPPPGPHGMSSRRKRTVRRPRSVHDALRITSASQRMSSSFIPDHH